MSRVPIVREISWLGAIPQLLLLALLCYAASRFFPPGDSTGLLVGAAVYLALSYGLRNTVGHEHRVGIRLVQSGRFEEAIPHFERSAAFLQRHPWVDRFRSLTLMSASRMTYREMALCNIAFSLAQLGRGAEAIQVYERVLEEYPDNALATTALRMIRTFTSAR